MDNSGELTIGGRTFKTRKATHALRGEMEGRIRELRREHAFSIGRVILNLASEGGASDIVVKMLIDALINQTSRYEVTSAEIRSYVESTAGLSHIFYVMVRDEHPDDFPDLASAQGFIASLPIDFVRGALDEAATAQPEPVAVGV